MSLDKSTLILLCLLAFVRCQNNTEINNGVPTNKTIKTFKEEEKEILSSVNSILKRILPYVVQNSDSVSISPQCVSAMTNIFVNLRKLKGWTLQLLDSIGKPTAGILRGTSYTMGDYDQCLDITVTRRGQQQQDKPEDVLFTGKYCHILSQASPSVHSASRNYKTGKISGSELGRMEEAIDAIPFVPMMPKYMTHLFGLCIPSVCSEDDITKVFGVRSLGGMTYWNCHLRANPSHGMFGFFLLLVIAGTAIDLLVRYSTRNNFLQYNKGKLLSIAVSFSIYSNAERFAKTNQDVKPSPDTCFRGLVIGSIICIIFSNTYFLPHEAFYRQAGNLKNLEHYLSQVSFTAIVCLSLAIETLFLSTGFLISYCCTSDSEEIEATRMDVLKTTFYYYARMCLPLLFCIGILFLLPLLGSGPLWHDVIDTNIEQCQTGWWTYLALYGNFQSIHEQCFPHLWLVPCLIQTAVAASFFTCICCRCLRFGVSLLFIAMFGCNFAVGWFTYTNNLPPSYLPYFVGNVSDQFWKISFSTPLSHFSSCGIGIILGLMVTKKRSLTLKPISLLLGWVISMGLLCSVIFLLYLLREETDATNLGTAIYAALHRTCFSVSIGWIALACAFGYGGFVNTFLSMKALDPLYRTSYFAYLIHFIVITYHIGIARERFYYSHVELILRGFSYSCVTYILSCICHILIEMPIRSIKWNILSTAEQVVFNNYSNGLKQVDVLRSVQITDHKAHNTSFSPDGSNSARRY